MDTKSIVNKLNIYQIIDNRKFQALSADQICEIFECSKSSLISNFNRTRDSIEKKFGVILAKLILKQGIYYYICDDRSDEISIYRGNEDIPIPVESLGYQAYAFFIFLAISASEFGAYRGTRENLLNYVGIKPTKKNIDMLNEVLITLENKKVIMVRYDEDYIIVYLKAGVEKQYSISVTMLRECQKIANENNKNFNKVAQLIQVWEAVRICEQNQPFTYADLTKLTGLSYKQIRDVKKLLESNNMFVTSRAGSYFKCLGMNVQLNGIYDPLKKKQQKNN